MIKPYSLDLSKLSPPSKRFTLFRTAKGFRPLLLQSSLFDCYPFSDFERKKEIVLNNKQAEIDVLIEQLSYEFIEQKIQENTELLKSLKDELANTPSSPETIEKRYILKGEVEAVESFLRAAEKAQKAGKDKKTGKYDYSTLNMSGFNEKDPRYQKALAEKAELEKNFFTYSNSGTCDACGITLNTGIEKHTDFLTLDEFNLCPYCHACEHLDDSNVRGSLSYLPYFSQEQINLFYHAYHFLKFLLEGTKEDIDFEASIHREYFEKIEAKKAEISALQLKCQQEIDQHKSLGTGSDEKSDAIFRKYDQQIAVIKGDIATLLDQEAQDKRLDKTRQRRAFMDHQINNSAVNFTYGELLNYMTKLDRYFHLGENVLIQYYESKAEVNRDALKREYEDRIGADIEDLSKFIQNENGVFSETAKNYINQRLFTYNIDSPNSPPFYASFFMKKGLHLQSRLSKEEKLNVLTRLSGVRYLPNYEHYKVFIQKWTKDCLNGIEFDTFLNDFITVNIRLFSDDVAAASQAQIRNEKINLSKPDNEKSQAGDKPNTADKPNKDDKSNTENKPNENDKSDVSQQPNVQAEGVEMEAVTVDQSLAAELTGETQKTNNEVELSNDLF